MAIENYAVEMLSNSPGPMALTSTTPRGLCWTFRSAPFVHRKRPAVLQRGAGRRIRS